MFGECMVWMAKGHASPEEQAVGLLLIAVIVVITLVAGAIRSATTAFDVNYKNGVPYCPRCNRQVSYRRDYCRACGYKLYQPIQREAPAETRPLFLTPPTPKGPPPAPKPPPPPSVLSERARLRREAREARLQELEAKGITPGPTAWFWLLPDWAQPIVLGVGGSAFFLFVMWVAYQLAS